MIVVHSLEQNVSPSLQWILYGPALIDVNKGTSVCDITKRQFLLQQLHCDARAIDPEWWYFCESGPSTSSETQGLWVDFKSGRKSPWGHCLTRLVPNGRSRSGIWLVPENLCVFLPNQSEVCFRVLSCVLTLICTRSSVARLVCLGCATKLCPRWKVSVSAHNVREIDQIVRENLTRNYTEYFRRYPRERI